jgi:acyl-CoA synthetase (NDP forming)
LTEVSESIATARVKVDALLNPRNVVIVGASDRPGNWAQRVWRNLKRYGYEGPVYPFNPGRDAVWDTRCYRNFAELPEAPDHLVVLIPAFAVPDTLAEAAKAGARSATVMTSGFAEDPKAHALSDRLKGVIADSGLAVSGPNCLGNLHAAAHLMTMPDDRPQAVVPGPIAIVGQSGGIAMSIKRTLEERGNACGSVVTSGNEAGLTTADYIAYYAGLPEIKAIVCYLEAVHNRDAFLDACRMARDAGKPVIAMKLGASEHGRAAALAHTGRLAGSMAAFDAVAGAAGVVRVANLDAVVEAAEYFVHAPVPKGRGLGAITFSGGLRGLMLDAAAAQGLKYPDLAPATRRRLESLLTVGTIIGNPLDAGFAALTSQDAYLTCVDILLDDPGIDVLLLQEELPRGPGTERKESNLKAVETIASRARKPIAFVTMISHGLTDYARALRAGLPHLAFLQEIDKSASAVKSVIEYAAREKTPAMSHSDLRGALSAHPEERSKSASRRTHDRRAIQLRRLVARLGNLRDPVRRPLDRDLLGDGAGAGVVDHDLADAAGAEAAQQLVEALAAMAERRRIGAIAEGDDAEAPRREVGPVAFERGEKTLRVVRHVALAIGRAADQEDAGPLENVGIEPVHRHDLDRVAFVLQPVAHLLGDELGGAGHRAGEDGDGERHGRSGSAVKLI